MCPEVDHFVPCFPEVSNEFFLQLEPTVIGGDPYTHKTSPLIKL
jgi:hypothetical protein